MYYLLISLSSWGNYNREGGIKVQKHDASKCSVKSSLQFLEQFAENKLCGKCVPCRVGTMQAINIHKMIIEGLGKKEYLNLLLFISDRMEKSSMCKLGKDTGSKLGEFINNEDFVG